MRKRILHIILVIGLMLFASEGYAAGIFSVTNTPGSLDAAHGFNCGSVNVFLQNTSTSSSIFFLIYRAPLGTTNFTNISSGSIYDQTIPMNSIISKSYNVPGDFTYLVRFYENDDYSTLLPGSSDQTIDVKISSNPVLTRLDAIETSSLVDNDGLICSDASARLTPVLGLGSGSFNDYKYIWTAPGSLIIPENASNYQTAIGGDAGTYYLQIEYLTTHCQSATVSQTVTVFQIPTVGSISGLHEICVGKSIELTASGHSNGLSPYTLYWRYNGTSIGGTTISPTATVNGFSAGIGDVIYSVKDSRKCMSNNSDPFNITVNPLPDIPTAVPSSVPYDALPHLADATVVGLNIVRDWYNSSTFGSISSQPTQTIVGTNTQFAEARNSLTGCISASRVSVTSEVIKATLTLTANNKQKVYDKSIFSGVYDLYALGFATNESFGNLSGTATYSGTSQTAVNAGTYPIIPSGFFSSNYNINYVNGTLTIDKKNIIVQGTSVITKVYDATTSATLTGSSFLTAIAAGTGTSTDNKPYIGDNIHLLSTANFLTKIAEDNKSVSAIYSFTAGSTETGNYTLVQPFGLLGNITKKAIDEINPITTSKVYDKTNISVGYNSSLNTPRDLPGAGASNDGTAYSSDDISIVPGAIFLTVDVTTSGSISSTSTLSGTDQNNYTLTRAIGLTPRAITRKNLTMQGLTIPSSKVYDGTISATVSGGSGSLKTPENGAINTALDGNPYIGDDVILTGTAVGTYNSKNVLTANLVSYTGVSLAGAQAGNYTLTLQTSDPATITPKSLTFSGLSVPTPTSKVYNGNKIAIVSGSPTTLGTLQPSESIGTGNYTDGIPYTGDDVNLTGIAVGTYNTKDVLTANSVAFTGVSLAGAQSSNYTLTPHIPQAATITKKSITITGAIAANKIYDATTNAIVTNGQLQGVETVDASTVNLIQSGIFSSKDVANNIPVTATCTLSGADASNYDLTQPILAAKNITKKDLTMFGLTVPSSKIYDATTSAVVGGTASLQATETAGTGSTNDGKPYIGDVVSITGTAIGTYDSKDVLNATKVTFSALSLMGNNAGNYNLKIQDPILATIKKKKLTMFGLSVADTKVYDGNKNAKVLGNSFLQNPEAPGSGTNIDGKPYIGDFVNINGTPKALYNSKNVVEANKVSFAGLVLNGVQSSNYDLAVQSDYPATITPLNINLTADQQTKIYGDDDPLFTYTNDPIIQGDTFTGELSRVLGQNVGAYSILQGSLDLGTNYTITYKSAYLVITEASMFIKPDTTYRTYGDDPLIDGLSTTKFKAYGLKYNETVKSVRLYFPTGLGSGNDKKDTIGLYSYGVKAKDPYGGTALVSNYKIVSFPGDIRVKSFPITIFADAKTKRQSEQDPVLTYKLSAKPFNGDTVSGQLTRDPGDLPGTYSILQGTIAINNNYDITYVSNLLTILTVENIFVVPNAFTPNGDGLNDKLKILYNSSVVGVNYFQIFNKAGKLVFETKDIETGWDGRVNGIVQESDAYYWIAEYKTWNHLSIQRKGTVVLLK